LICSKNIPNIGKITLLIRRNRTTSAQRRFEKIVEESPTFDTLQERYARTLGAFLREKVEVVEGDVSLPGLGLDEATQARLAKSLDLIVNSAGLTVSIPICAMRFLPMWIPQSTCLTFCGSAARRADASFHLLCGRHARWTGHRGLHDNYNPANDAQFDAEREVDSLRETVRHVEERSEARTR